MNALWHAFVDVLVRIAPYLLLGFTIAGILHALVPSHWLARALGGHGLGPITRGALVGIPLPLCSCSVIPVAAELRKRGAGRGATAAFLVATPETGVDSIATSFAVLHPMMVLFRPLAALVTALVTGFAIERFTDGPAAPAQAEHDCCHREPSVDERAKGWWGGMRYAFVDLFGEIAGYLLPALLITAALTAWIELPQKVTEAISSPWLQMLLLLVASAPIYVCATAATPIAAALIAGGFSPGAALVFLLAGPATNVLTMSSVASHLGRGAAAVYIASIAVCSLAFGALLDWWFAAYGDGAAAAAAVPAHQHDGWLGPVSAVVVAALLVAHLTRRAVRAAKR